MIYKGTAFDDIQRLALMIYSHKRLMIYTASRDYGDKSVPFLCFSLFVPQIRGSLDYARDDGTPLVISTKHSAWRNPLMRSSTLSFRGFKKPEETPGKDTDLQWSLRCKWSFPTESEVCLWQVKFHQRWSCGGKSVWFPCILLFVPQIRGSLDFARDDVFLWDRHIIQA